MRSIGSARKRLLDAAYELFANQGINRVGVDTIVAVSGCAKASLYNNFESKEGLAIAFLDQREELWTRSWLEQEVKRRVSAPEARLLSIFDVFHEWFQLATFEGCSFVNVLLESDQTSAVRAHAGEHLARIRTIIREFATEAGLSDLEDFCQAWHMLMKGSIVSAGEGNRAAAHQAQKAAKLVLAGWPRA